MSGIVKFGEDVEGYRIPVLNEREIRAAAPRYAPTLILGRLIVRNQVPEYVGARQKRFAWIIGVALAAAFGICLGCKLYPLVTRQKPEYCPGEVCEVGERQAIQRTSPAQVLILLGLVAYVVLVAVLFQASFGARPHALFGG